MMMMIRYNLNILFNPIVVMSDKNTANVAQTLSAKVLWPKPLVAIASLKVLWPWPLVAIPVAPPLR